MLETLLNSSQPKHVGKRVSIEEYMSLEEDGFKYNMHEGVLSLAPSGDFDHGIYQGLFITEINLFLKANPIGKAVTEIDVFLPDGGDVLRPDISFIFNENMHIAKTHIHGVPDLICEILSPTSIQRDLGIKADRYLKNGVKEYWVVYAKEKKIELWINQNTNSWEILNSNVLKSNLLKGFEIQQDRFFEEN